MYEYEYSKNKLTYVNFYEYSISILQLSIYYII